MKISHESQRKIALERIKELDALYEALEDYESTRFKIMPTCAQCEQILSRVM